MELDISGELMKRNVLVILFLYSVAGFSETFVTKTYDFKTTLPLYDPANGIYGGAAERCYANPGAIQDGRIIVADLGCPSGTRFTSAGVICDNVKYDSYKKVDFQLAVLVSSHYKKLPTGASVHSVWQGKCCVTKDMYSNYKSRSITVSGFCE